MAQTDVRIIVPTASRQVSISDIPDLSLVIGETHDMGQYINGPVVSSQVLGLNESIATYSDITKSLTAVATGSMTGLQLEVTT